MSLFAAALGFGFVGCSDGDDDNKTTQSGKPGKPGNPGDQGDQPPKPSETPLTYTYTYGGNNSGLWLTDATSNTTSTADGTTTPAKDGLKVEFGSSASASKYLILDVAGTGAEISMTGFTAASGSAQQYVKVELLDENGGVVASATGTTPTGQHNGTIKFSDEDKVSFEETFDKIRFTCTTRGKAYGIVTLSIIVTEALPHIKSVTSIEVSPNEAQSLAVNGSVKLTATVSPSDATDTSVEWTSSVPSVASVSDDGLVTGLSVGNTVITAKAKGGRNVVVTVNVSVANISVNEVNVSETNLTLDVNDEITLTASVDPSSVLQDVTWTSNDTNIATVTAGKIKAVAEGTTTITVASVADSSKTKTVNVTVKNPVDWSTVSFSKVAADCKDFSSATDTITFTSDITSVTAAGLYSGSNDENGTAETYTAKIESGTFQLYDNGDKTAFGWLVLSDDINSGAVEVVVKAKVNKSTGKWAIMRLVNDSDGEFAALRTDNDKKFALSTDEGTSFVSQSAAYSVTNDSSSEFTFKIIIDFVNKKAHMWIDDTYIGKRNLGTKATKLHALKFGTADSDKSTARNVFVSSIDISTATLSN